MIPDEAVAAAANAISECSGMRFDGFWSRVDDLAPEDRAYSLAEARAALEAAAPHMLSHEREQTRLAHVDAMVNAATVDALQTQLDKIEALHQPVTRDGSPVGCALCDWEHPDGGTWPCATLSEISAARV